MKVPLTVGDFLDRAETVYPDSLAVVDEPGHAGVLGRITYREMAARARGMALALDRMQVPVGRAGGDRVARTPARFMISFFGVSGYGRVLVPVNYRLRADEISYIVEHSGATVLLVDPEIDEVLSGVTAKERIVLDGVDDAELFAAAAPTERSPAAGSRTRTRPAPSTTPRAPPRGPRECSSPTAAAGSTRRRSAGTPPSPTGTCCCTPCRCSTSTAGACPTRSPRWAAPTS